MPVDYTIAARGAQGNTAPDFANMLAQYQMMGARAQQQQLEQLQYQKLQQELQQQNALRGMLGGLDISSPATINALAQAGYLPESLSVMGAQRQAEAQRAAAEAQRATAGYHQGMLGLAQAKLPYEERKLEQEALKESRAAESAQQTALYHQGMLEIAKSKLPLEEKKLAQEALKEQRLARSAELSGEKTALERDAEMLKNAENQAAKIVMAGGKGYDKFYAGLHDNLKSILKPDYDEEALTNFTTQMATVQENLKRSHEFELVDRINPQTGLKEKVAVSKYAPEKGGKAVAGTESAIQDKFGFMHGPEGTGTVIRTNPVTGTAESLPLTSGIPAPRVDMGAPPSAPANVPEPVPGTPEYTNRRFGREALDAIGFNPKTGEDRVSKLIKQSTSGGAEAIGAGISGFFGRGTSGAKAIGQIKPIINNLILEKMNGKLGAGISNEDREFFKSTLGNLDDPSIPENVRLASWNEAKRRLAKYAGDMPTSSDNRPSLNEIFK